jgi:hypothetical protein
MLMEVLQVMGETTATRRVTRDERRWQRRKVRAEAKERKERTLQVRIEETLFAAVKDAAERSGRTVSDEVRACLAEHYDVVPALPSIIGWQPFNLAAAAGCESCRATHHAGDAMFLAITREERERLLVCPACKARVEAKAT